MIRLKVMFYDWAGQHLLETPLSEDQKVLEVDDGELQVEATVMASGQFRWWLLGFGDCVEVMNPMELRKEFAEMSKNMVSIYKTSLEQ